VDLDFEECPLDCAVYGCSDCQCWQMTSTQWTQCFNPTCDIPSNGTGECFELRECSELDSNTCNDTAMAHCNWISNQEPGYCTDVTDVTGVTAGSELPVGIIVLLAVLGFCVVLLVPAILYLIRRWKKLQEVKDQPRKGTNFLRKDSNLCESKPRSETIFIYDENQAKARAVTVYCSTNQDYEEEGLLSKKDDTKKEEATSLSKLINQPAIPIEKILDCDFENTPKIGEGSFGYVVKAIYENMEVALKRFKIPWTEWSEKEKKDFQIEIGEGLKLRHENIVRYYGWTEDPVSVIMELCPHGSLKDYFNWADEEGENISNTKLLNWAIGAAKGINFLHSKNLVHRDIAARNLLLSKHFEIRVSDFGMSRIVSTSEKELGKTKTSVGPLKWMPPESLRDQEYSKKTDTYAFGITLWEIFSQGEEPYAGKSPVEAAFFALSSEKNRPSMASIPFTYVIPIMNSCWKYSADARPHMKDVRKSLSDLRFSLQRQSDGANSVESGHYTNLNRNPTSEKSDRLSELDSNYVRSARFSGRSELSSNYDQALYS